MNKKAQKIAASKKGHRVLLFGEQVFGSDSRVIRPHENAEIDAVRLRDYAKLKRLTDYTLVILDYVPFPSSGGISTDKQNVFDKMMMEALEGGTTCCFVHYNEQVPEFDHYAFDTGHMKEEDVKACRKQQLGFRWLYKLAIGPQRLNQPIVTGTTTRNEFRPFISKWGASHNRFLTIGDGKFDDTIYESQGFPVAFSVLVRAGRIMMMPFQRDFERPNDLSDAIYALVDCLLTYITKSLTELPAWARSPFFGAEQVLYDECKELEARLEESRKALEPFLAAKELMCQAEYTLERTIPAFVTQHLQLLTQRNDEFKEDFWILNASGERVVIAEVKSYVKGFKRSGIFSIYNHRETNKLQASFPALLVVNANMQAASWQEKDRGIDKQDYEVAAQNNVLVLRTEDLVRLWDALRTERITPEDILSAFTSKTGWLQVQSDGTMIDHK